MDYHLSFLLQVSQIAVQHQALGRLQVGLVDEMEARGNLDNPETQKIIDKHRKVRRIHNHCALMNCKSFYERQKN